jgi:hypothetical protein
VPSGVGESRARRVQVASPALRVAGSQPASLPAVQPLRAVDPSGSVVTPASPAPGSQGVGGPAVPADSVPASAGRGIGSPAGGLSEMRIRQIVREELARAGINATNSSSIQGTGGLGTGSGRLAGQVLLASQVRRPAVSEQAQAQLPANPGSVTRPPPANPTPAPATPTSPRSGTTGPGAGGATGSGATGSGSTGSGSAGAGSSGATGGR